MNVELFVTVTVYGNQSRIKGIGPFDTLRHYRESCDCCEAASGFAWNVRELDTVRQSY